MLEPPQPVTDYHPAVSVSAKEKENISKLKSILLLKKQSSVSQLPANLQQPCNFYPNQNTSFSSNRLDIIQEQYETSIRQINERRQPAFMQRRSMSQNQLKDAPQKPKAKGQNSKSRNQLLGISKSEKRLGAKQNISLVLPCPVVPLVEGTSHKVNQSVQLLQKGKGQNQSKLVRTIFSHIKPNLQHKEPSPAIDFEPLFKVTFSKPIQDQPPKKLVPRLNLSLNDNTADYDQSRFKRVNSHQNIFESIYGTPVSQVLSSNRKTRLPSAVQTSRNKSGKRLQQTRSGHWVMTEREQSVNMIQL
ncbi:hypothetical protein FGO68_gene15434 [Halteria grandinella]|uniref:Uncharacterized protein n=1 Tax=Halteria grandinella TaxID=5974 RepID=A0A8J8NSC6_HALGN|nr:hypothetical protein FGO68_gene15434 [Halteria grandinella]